MNSFYQDENDGNLRGGIISNIFDTLHNFSVLLVKGRNGKDLLMLNGYTYYQHKLLRDGFRWSCTQMGSRSCRGFLHVTKKMLVVRAQTEHTHPPSTYFLENIKRQSLREDDGRQNASEKYGPLSLKIASIHGRLNFTFAPTVVSICA
nr:uncharacterized protein LOC113393099 [Vanessa tameamea]